jgi:hypothetical protein
MFPLSIGPLGIISSMATYQIRILPVETFAITALTTY